MQWADEADLKRWTPLVKRCASKVLQRVPASVESADLISAGMLGLNEALTRFDDSQGVAFEVFATLRIRGAMMDLLRQDDPLSRGARRDSKRIEVAQRRLQHELGRPAREAEVAQALGMTPDQYRQASQAAVQFVDIEDEPELAGEDDPAALLERAQTESAAAVRIAALPDKEWYAMSQVVVKDRKKQDIASDLGVTPSRVSQLLDQGGARASILSALTDPAREARVTKKRVSLDAVQPVTPPAGYQRSKSASPVAVAWKRLAVGMAYELPQQQAKSMARHGKGHGGSAIVRKHPEKPGVWLVVRLG